MAWSLQFLGYLRTLRLKFQEATSKIEVLYLKSSNTNETLDHTPLWSQNLMKPLICIHGFMPNSFKKSWTDYCAAAIRKALFYNESNWVHWSLAPNCTLLLFRPPPPQPTGRRAAAPPESSVQSSTNHFYALMCFIYFVLLFIFETNWFSHGFLNCRSLRLDNVFEGYS